MSETVPMVERRAHTEIVTTVNEAAYVAGVSRSAVNQAIDRREIRTRKPRRRTDPPGRMIGGPELVYLRIQRLLSSSGRKEVYRRLMGARLDGMPQVIEMEGNVKLDIGEPLAQVRSRLDEIAQIKDEVEENPLIRGGEAVFRGTRVPVFMIAEFLRQGVPREEILEDYPALTEASLDIAPRYAELYPRRGRPRQAPWQAQAPTHVFRPEDLRTGER
ncbi:MAG TPA: DUF433 domain-containing protein [Longimicrobium sp.]|jgi:uncharacterized protein (DUF433 family)|uniref:DUF433 domain-containing protein n=1 Tax=Longimicrobium sp. TaxID=2029185 RepID=UPI002ED806EB